MKRKENKLPPQEYLKKLFTYDKITGKLYNRIDRGFRGKEGMEAGSISYSKKRSHCKYRVTRINNKTYKIHRIIWVYNYGEIPKNLEMDHIDGDGLNNKLNNLRLVTHMENARNQKLYRTRVDGSLMGVSFIEETKRWRVRIGIGHKKKKNLGMFATKEEANKAKIKAERELGYFKGHGRKELKIEYTNITR